MAITISGTTGISGVDGSAGTPAVQGTDTNTGVFYPAADTVAWTTGGSERVRVDSSGNVGIGTSSFTHPFTVKKSNAGDWTCKFSNSSATGVSGFGYYDNSDTWKGYVGYDNGDANFLKLYATTSVGIKFITNTTETMRISSAGILHVGTTSQYAGATNNFYRSGAGQIISVVTSVNSGNNDMMAFLDGDSNVCGYIQANTTANTLSYVTSSDYRLKENIQPMTDGLTKVMQLKPSTWNWKSAPEVSGQGFIAHELQEVVPDAVCGEKDELDADNNPKYQGVDTSFLVATLTAAIQELKGLVDTQASTITALTARIEALETK